MDAFYGLFPGYQKEDEMDHHDYPPEERYIMHYFDVFDRCMIPKHKPQLGNKVKDYVGSQMKPEPDIIQGQVFIVLFPKIPSNADIVKEIGNGI